MRNTERRERGAETQQREKQAPCREPDMGLNPRTPGSRPELKAGAKPLGHPGVPSIQEFCNQQIYNKSFQNAAMDD